MRVIKKLHVALIIVCMTILLAAVTVNASVNSTTNQKVLNARDGVFQVAVGIHVGDNPVEYCVPIGSGFLIGTEGSAQTLITSYHVIHSVDEPTIRSLLADAGTPVAADVKIKLDYRVIINRDVPIIATVVKESEQADFSILTLEQPIYGRNILALDDVSNIVQTQDISALGYPELVKEIRVENEYVPEDVVITNGKVSSVGSAPGGTGRADVPVIGHSAVITPGNSGGPLVDENGIVVGINTMVYGDNTGNYYYAIQISEVIKVLDALGINYIPGSDVASNTTTTTQPSEEVPEESIEPTTAVSVTAAPAPTAAPEKESNNMIWIIAAIAIFAVIVVLVVVLILVNKSGKKKQMTPPPNMNPMGGPMGTPPYGGAPGGAQRPPFDQNASNGGQPRNYNNNPVVSPNPQDNEGSDATTVLDEGSGATTVLGGNTAGSAYLTRGSNGEKIMLNSPAFVIGKEKKKVNYWISDNTSVSRCHARITKKGSQYFITDLGSTNFTFVNGVKAMPNVEVPLNDHAKIKLSDVDFEFHMS